MKTFLANTFAKWFKRLGFAGALRWRILYWTYRLWPGLHIRDREWDFVLNYLPKIDDRQFARVLDVGATSSLFIYELARRGYSTYGVDIKPYQEKLPYRIRFTQFNIAKSNIQTGSDFDFVICISVLENIDNQKGAMLNMAKMLKQDGKLLLTIPTEIFAQGHDFEGFTYDRFRDLIFPYFKLIEYTERKGQICACLVKR